MLNNWNFKKHIIMSIIISMIVCLLSYIIINPSSSSVTGLLFTNGVVMSINTGIVNIVVITSITLLLTLFSYKIIKKQQKK